MEKKNIAFWKDNDAVDILRHWWVELDSLKGDRAELRRAKEIFDVIMCQSFHRLRNRFLSKGYFVRGKSAERLALVAGILSHVRENDSKENIALQMARPVKGKSEGARVSGLRFRQLLSKVDINDLYRELIRAVCLLGNKCNIISLADSVYKWNDDVRKKWAFDYYSNAKKEL